MGCRAVGEARTKTPDHGALNSQSELRRGLVLVDEPAAYG